IRQSEFALENAETFSSQMSPVLMTYGCTGSTQSEPETLERAKAKENRISVAKTRATGGTVVFANRKPPNASTNMSAKNVEESKGKTNERPSKRKGLEHRVKPRD